MDAKELEKQVKSLIVRLGEIKRSLLRLSELEKKVSSPIEMENVIKRLEKSLESLKIMNEWLKGLEALLDSQRSLLEEKKVFFRIDFSKRLLEEVRKTFGLDLEGEFPEFYIGFYRVRLNVDRNRAKILWGIEQIKEVPLDVEAVVKTIKEFEDKLNSPFEAENYFKMLKTAYDKCLSSPKLSNSIYMRRVPIMEILRELIIMLQPKGFWVDPKKRSFREYSRVQFAYDIYRLRRSKFGDRIRLWVATFDQTRDPSKFLYIPDDIKAGRGTRYAYLEILADEENRGKTDNF